MIRLIIIVTFGLVLSLPTLTLALDSYSVFGVQLPIVKSEGENELNGGNVEKDFMSFYTSPKTANTTASLITADQKSDDEYISVFGVQFPRSSRL